MIDGAHTAATDCEALRPLIGDAVWQPINTMSSLLMSVFGLFLLLQARRWTDPSRRRTLVLLGLALISTGLGSAAFHGPGGFASAVAHDVTIAAIPMAAAVGMFAERRHLDPYRWMIGLMAVLVAARWFSPAHVASFAVATAAMVWLSTDRYRRGLIDWRALGAGAVLLGAARLAFALSRTGAVLCRPDSLFQGHGLWHLLVAAAVVAVAVGVGLLPPRLTR